MQTHTKPTQPRKNTVRTAPHQSSPPAYTSSSAMSPEQMLSLQAQVGNQAVMEMTNSKATALPDHKTIMDRFSRHSNDDVQAYNPSSKPAELQAEAYTQGTDIHLGAREEEHLPHEAAHVVQQKQGRVQPTVQL